ncbi:MAG TPA: sigma-70 family RNA polymerase sigma factor [Ktedonobacterales bacterium]
MRQDTGDIRPADTPDAPDFVALLDHHQQALLAFLRGLVNDLELALDLLQEVFCDAWRARLRGAPPFAGAATSPDQRNWLFHTAYCRAISARRHAGVLRWESLEAGAEPLRERLEEPWRLEERVSEQDEALAALAALATEDAASLLLNILHGFTAAEIATVLQITPAAAKKRLSRAKQRLRAAYLSQNPDRQEAHS